MGDACFTEFPFAKLIPHAPRYAETWDTARRTKNFDETVGVMTLLKLFELEPLTKRVFDIRVDHTPSEQELKESGHLVHAIRMFQMFDAALNMLGPDTEVHWPRRSDSD